jgi:hypothetical protein
MITHRRREPPVHAPRRKRPRGAPRARRAPKGVGLRQEPLGQQAVQLAAEDALSVFRNERGDADGGQEGHQQADVAAVVFLCGTRACVSV